ncbi:alpha/beta hydrolase family protein [Deinococcus oregonensis]|uniref:Alpha/beta hydrolase family protein n=1 Tax=Deinococcus oregonensis TaxID=1805970 RepID=A0ABV6B4F2_9DEIO
MKRLLLGLTLTLLGSSLASAAEVRRQAFTAQFGAFTSRGEVTLPAGVPGPLPTVLLIHGSTPMDKDATVAFGDQVRSQIFRQLADTLSAQGFAVIRYDKRFAGDAAQYAGATLQDFVADARTALQAARQVPGVDPARVFLYGWSEGSGVAAQLALSESGVQGLIVQGPVARSYAQTLAGQFSRVTLPYLRAYAPSVTVGVAELLEAYAGSGGANAKGGLFFFWDPTSTPTQPVLRRQMDVNGDGRLDLDQEAAPFVNAAYANPLLLGSYAPGKALPGLTELAPRLKVPVLILQGEQDANIPVNDARELDAALARAGHTDHTLQVYPGLGHSLGAASRVIDDDFRPMQVRPLNDLTSWLTAHLR